MIYPVQLMSCQMGALRAPRYSENIQNTHTNTHTHRTQYTHTVRSQVCLAGKGPKMGPPLCLPSCLKVCLQCDWPRWSPQSPCGKVYYHTMQFSDTSQECQPPSNSVLVLSPSPQGEEPRLLRAPRQPPLKKSIWIKHVTPKSFLLIAPLLVKLRGQRKPTNGYEVMESRWREGTEDCRRDS